MGRAAGGNRENNMGGFSDFHGVWKLTLFITVLAIAYDFVGIADCLEAPGRIGAAPRAIEDVFEKEVG